MLLDGDTETAHKLHLKLMIDYVGEVSTDWYTIEQINCMGCNTEVFTNLSTYCM